MLFKLKGVLPQVLMALFALFVLFMIPSQIVTMSETTNEVGPQFFPKIVSITIIILSLASALKNLFMKNKRVAPTEEETATIERSFTKTIFVFIGLIVWGLLLPILGFVITTYLGTLAFMLIIGNKKKLQLILVPIIFTGITYYLTIVMLKLSFPTGIFM